MGDIMEINRKPSAKKWTESIPSTHCIYQNIQLEKWDAVRYGIRIAGLRLCENITMIKALVEVESIERFLSVYLEKKISLKAFDELQIQGKWGRVHKDLGTE